MTLKVLGKPESINVCKVLWLCAELGLEPGRELWGAGHRSTDDAAFRALNPNAMVPVLVDGDFVLWESNAICRYLAQREARTDLLPSEARARAIVEQWMDWQIAELNPAWRYAFMARVRNSPAHRDVDAIATSVAQWNRCMQVLDDQLARSGAHVTGAPFTLADIVLGLSVLRWRSTPIEKPELAHVAAYFERLRLRPAFVRHGVEAMA